MYFIYAIILAAAQFHHHTCTALATTTPKLELKYFNARGAAETARLILAIAGKTNDYTDTRYDITPGTMTSPTFLAAKESGELTTNLRRAPVLVVPSDDDDGASGGGTIGQSKAIERYLARRYDLMGSNDVEEAQIDCIAEHCRDVKDAMARKGFSFFARDKSDEEKAALRKEWYEIDMPSLLEKMEEAVRETSRGAFAVGGTLSYADVVIFSLLRDCTMEGDKEDTAKAAEQCATLNAIADGVASHPNVEKWLKERPATAF